MHPATGEEVAKLYAGNPMTALGRMLMLRKEFEKAYSETFDSAAYSALDAIDECLKFMAEELSSVAEHHKVSG